MSPLVSIGIIRTSFGVNGWLKLFSHSGEWSHFKELKSVIIEDSRHEQRRTYDVEGFKMQHGGGLLKLVGIDSPESAKVLTGCSLLVPKRFAAQLKEDEWYIDDLVGLVMVDEEGREIGKVVAVIESSDDLLEIDRSDGSRFMVPFRRQFVSEPNFESQTIVLLANWLNVKE